MKSNYFLVHGSFGNPHVNWFPYLFKETEKVGNTVYCPQFPTGVGLQNYNNWSKLMRYYVDLGIINENTVIVGHSIAPIFICHFLIENNIRIKKLVFVCGFNNYLGINYEYDTVNKSMYCDNIERIHSLCSDITCFYSKNDPYVKYDAEKDFADKVSDKQIVIDDGKHLNSESGYTEFKQLLDIVM
jgi:predicted alpha/beta hydrolase family esterase